MTSLLGPWGLLPVAVPLFAFVAARLGAIAFAREARATVGDRAVAGVVLAFAAAIAAVRALSCFDAVTPAALITLLGGSSITLSLVRRDARFVWPDRAILRDAGVVATLLVAAAAVVLAIVAARWLPVWQWDSLGYHLPFVHFTLAARSVAGVPPELEYVGSYPHAVELFFVALRACLPDDRLVDLGQVPFGVAGAVVTAALARQAGGSARAAGVCGASWILIPAVFLQLPTDYVDVATATFFLAAIFFALSAPSPPALILGGLAVGLLAGSKASGPLPGAVLFGIVSVRGLRAGHRASVAGGLSLALLFGGGSYIDNLARHANPVWPLSLDVGPLRLAGTHSLTELLSAGANAPHLTGPLPLRLLRSLFALSSLPTYDMRVGGFGLSTVCSLPFALVWLVRKRSLALWLAFGSTLLGPDPAVARYVLAFPAVVLAAVAGLVGNERASCRIRTGLGGALATLGALQLAYAAPGLTGEGPPILAYAAMSEPERALAVGADGPPIAMAEARSRVGAGEAIAFDDHMDLADLAWDPLAPRSHAVVFLPASLSEDRVAGALAGAHVRVLVVGNDAPAGVWAAAHQENFERLAGRVSCRKGGCSVYVVR